MSTAPAVGTESMTFPQAVNDALRQALANDPSVFIMGEDIAHHGGMFLCTGGLLEEFGDKRVIDTPISESGFMGIALGAALSGKRPIVELMFFDFSLVAADQILNQIAKTRYMSGGTVHAPMVIRTQGGGYKGAAAQHSQMLEALYVHIPGLRVVAPSGPASAKGLLTAAVENDDPVLFVEHKQLYGVHEDVPTGRYVLPLDKASVVKEGKDLTIISYSFTLTLALEAAEQLAAEGISAEVIDLCSLNPVDWSAIEASVSKTHRVLVAQEAHLRCGVAADLAYQIQDRLFDELDAPAAAIGAANVPVPFAKELEEACLPTSAGIAAKARALLGR